MVLGMENLTGIAANIGKLKKQPDGQYRVYCAACGKGQVTGVICKRRKARGSLDKLGWVEKGGRWRCPRCSGKEGLNG